MSQKIRIKLKSPSNPQAYLHSKPFYLRKQEGS